MSEGEEGAGEKATPRKKNTRAPGRRVREGSGGSVSRFAPAFPLVFHVWRVSCVRSTTRSDNGESSLDELLTALLFNALPRICVTHG